jgi:hypothetical protein
MGSTRGENPLAMQAFITLHRKYVEATDNRDGASNGRSLQAENSALVRSIATGVAVAPNGRSI